MKLYVLTAGEYEEEEIVNIFSSVEKLEQFKKDFPNSKYNDYDVFELDNHPRVYKNKDVYWVLIKKDKTIEYKKVDKVYDNIKCINVPYRQGDYTSGCVWASTEEEAVRRAKKLFEKGDK